MTPEARKFRAQDAKQLLENPIFVEAFKAVGDYLQNQAISCNADDKDKTQRIIISQQLLAGLKREITRVVTDGNIAEVQMQEIEKKKKIFSFQR